MSDLGREVYLVFSRECNNRENDQYKMANHFVACDATSGKVYIITGLVDNPDVYIWEDKEVLGKARVDKLVFFETQGEPASLDVINATMCYKNLSQEEDARVMAAYNDYLKGVTSSPG